MTVDILTLLSGKWEDGTRPKDVFTLYVSKAPAEYLPTILDCLGVSQSKVQSGAPSSPRRLGDRARPAHAPQGPLHRQPERQAAGRPVGGGVCPRQPRRTTASPESPPLSMKADGPGGAAVTWVGGAPSLPTLEPQGP